MPFDRKHVWNVCAAVVILGLALSSVIQDSFHRSYLSTVAPGVPMDFPHYYVAGTLARLKPPENQLYYPPSDHRAGTYLDLRWDSTTPYGAAPLAGGLPAGSVTRPFDAPPFAALLMEPLSFLPWKSAYFVLQSLAALMLMGSVYLGLRLFRTGPPPALEVAVALAVAFLFMPFKRNVMYGNIDLATLFLWAAGVFLFSRKRTIPSAFCFALGTVIKMMPVFAVPIFALRRQWRWLAYYVVWSALLLLVSVGAVGWRNHVLWAGQVAPALSCGMKGFYNRSLTGLVFALKEPQGLLNDLPGPAGWCVFTKALSGTAYLAFLFWCWKKRRDSPGLVFEMTLLPLVVLLVSPLSWPQHYVMAIFPLTCLWMLSREAAGGAAKLDLILLACCTLTFGSALPEYVARALGPAGELLVMASWVAATLALVWVGMRMYGNQVRERLQPAVAPVSAALVDR